jgi:hypothetical protein
VTTTQTTIPVCAGTCTDVPVDVPGVASQPSHVCVTAQDRSGATTVDTCTPASTPRLVRCSSPSTGYYVVDENGNVLLDGCVDTPTPTLGLRRCTIDLSDASVNSYQVYDRSTGEVWIDGCAGF